MTDIPSSNATDSRGSKIMMIGHYTATIVAYYHTYYYFIWQSNFRIVHWESLKSPHLTILIYKIPELMTTYAMLSFLNLYFAQLKLSISSHVLTICRMSPVEHTGIPVAKV